jgi:hypothetical protein
MTATAEPAVILPCFGTDGFLRVIDLIQGVIEEKGPSSAIFRVFAGLGAVD